MCVMCVADWEVFLLLHAEIEFKILFLGILDEKVALTVLMAVLVLFLLITCQHQSMLFLYSHHCRFFGDPKTS